MPTVRDALAALELSVVEGPGVTAPAARRAAAMGSTEDSALARYLDQVRGAAYRVTDEEVAALRAAGHSDDELFELTVAASFGAAKARLDAGLAAVAAAWEDDA